MRREDSITLDQHEQQRLQVLNQVLAGHWSVRQAAEVLGLSERQLWRLKAGYSSKGAVALAHGNRGRLSPGRIPDSVRSEVVELMRGAYAGCNDSHLRDLLASRDGLLLGRKTVERIRREAGIAAARKRRAPRHRSRRDRMAQAGMLLQIDGSRHQWFGTGHPFCSLLAAVDDATGAIVAAIFREQEDAQGYLLLLRQVLRERGIPSRSITTGTASSG